jgi:hypothetical protein
MKEGGLKKAEMDRGGGRIVAENIKNARCTCKLRNFLTPHIRRVSTLKFPSLCLAFKGTYFNWKLLARLEFFASHIVQIP